MTVTSAANPPAIGIFGGTFDPVHNAHLRIALDALEQLPLAEIRFIPSARPPHRGHPGASPEQRLSMLKQAVSGQTGFSVDDCELARRGPSYMVDTLAMLRQQFVAQPLCLILGWDAFREFASWQRWQAIFQLVHLIVIARPGGCQAELPAELAAALEQRRLIQPEALKTQLAGGILLQQLSLLDISASAIRERLRQGHSARYLVPETVLHYINERRLYMTSDIV